MALIAINLGYDLRIIPRSVFFTLMSMAVTTSYVTTTVLRRLIRKTRRERSNLGLAHRSFAVFRR